MKTKFKLSIKDSNGDKLIKFGIPDSDSEIVQTQRFRYKQYLKRGYINPNKAELDTDEYDDGLVYYFMATIDQEIIGFARLIIADPLPTEKDCFDFIEPSSLHKVPRNSRAEVSRLIVRTPASGQYLPRHLIMLGMFKLIVDFSKQEQLMGGYSFIKKSLKNKLKKLNFPVFYINSFKQKYQKGVLGNYFNDPLNPVYPVYYFIEDLERYIDRIFENNFLFERSSDAYHLKSGFRLKLISLYNVFFK